MRSHAGVWRLAATVNTHAKLIIRQREHHALSFQLGLREMLTLLRAGTKNHVRERDELCNVCLDVSQGTFHKQYLPLLYLPDITKWK